MMVLRVYFKVFAKQTMFPAPFPYLSITSEKPTLALYVVYFHSLATSKKSAQMQLNAYFKKKSRLKFAMSVFGYKITFTLKGRCQTENKEESIN